jgi:hypothetical protein
MTATHCPVCKTRLKGAPGIGPHCPNDKCSVLDNIDQATIDPTPYINRNARLIKGKRPALPREVFYAKPCEKGIPQDCVDCGGIFKPMNIIEVMPDLSNPYIETICIRCSIVRLFNKTRAIR